MKRSLRSVLAVGLLLAACSGAPASTESDLFFPTKPEAGGASNDALFQGPLVVRDGCVLIGRPDEYTLPIWWKGFTAERDDSGRLIVRDGEGGVVLSKARTSRWGGGYTVEFRPEGRVEPKEDQVRRVEDWLGYSIPERCLGPEVYGIWSVGET